MSKTKKFIYTTVIQSKYSGQSWEDVMTYTDEEGDSPRSQARTDLKEYIRSTQGMPIAHRIINRRELNK